MIECVFTVDYEIYGNGEGSLRELVFEPADALKTLFKKWNARLVLFVEAAELEIIESGRTDPAIDFVTRQIGDYYRDGFEIGLHLHPQWYRARFENNRWAMDYSEYNLCVLPRDRILQLVDRSIAYLRKVTGDPAFKPHSFRAGNWLFQPAQTVASVLAERGVRVDSSVLKGGRQHQHHLNYRRALANGYAWPFSADVNIPDPQGPLMEYPIYTRMVPPWKILTDKRIGLQLKVPSGPTLGSARWYRLLDFLRFRHPLKFDFCRLTIEELKGMLDQEIQKDKRNPEVFRPLVAIGHTKDLVDFETVESLLAFLEENSIALTTLKEISSTIPRNHSESAER
jgi:peptidoglycan/xylan/chitin deacetylase (PgdA/CDA1 family)